jgi:hypothetical protein
MARMRSEGGSGFIVGPDSSGHFSQGQAPSGGMNPDPQEPRLPAMAASRECNLSVMKGS